MTKTCIRVKNECFDERYLRRELLPTQSEGVTIKRSFQSTCLERRLPRNVRIARFSLRWSREAKRNKKSTAPTIAGRPMVVWWEFLRHFVLRTICTLKCCTWKSCHLFGDYFVNKHTVRRKLESKKLNDNASFIIKMRISIYRNNFRIVKEKQKLEQVVETVNNEKEYKNFLKYMVRITFIFSGGNSHWCGIEPAKLPFSGS